MDVTFLIGNGFDLNLGLKTSYRDFYNYYITKAPNDLFAKAIDKNYNLWADLELGLGQYTKEFTNAQIDFFFDGKERLERYLIEYLKKEIDRVIYKDTKAMMKQFQRQVVNFHMDLCQRDREHYIGFKNKANVINYRFIDFNYTNILDTIVNACLSNQTPFSQHTANNRMNDDFIFAPLHIHGTLDHELVLAVNDTSQIANPAIKQSVQLSRYLIKSAINEDSGYFNVEQTKKIIDGSTYIGIYGMSIGATDNIWWQYIIQWLLKDNNRRLLIYKRTEQALTGASRSRLNNKIKADFLSHQDNLENEKKDLISKQIIIVHNSNIFDLKGIELKPEKQELKLVSSQLTTKEEITV